MKKNFLKQAVAGLTRLLLLTACGICLPCQSIAQVIEYRGGTNMLFAVSDSRMVANVMEEGDSIKIDFLMVGYVHMEYLSVTFAYDTSKLTLTDSLFLNKIPFTTQAQSAMQLSPTLPPIYFIDATQHAPTGGIANMAYYKGGISTMTYDMNECWKVDYGKVDKVLTLFLKKKVSGAPLLSSDLGFYLSYMPQRDPRWGMDVLAVGYRYGSGSNINIGGTFMDYHNESMFAFRWPSTVMTNEATDIQYSMATLNGTFERGKFNPSQDSVLLIDNPYFTPSDAMPNKILGWDTISRYGFIYSDSDANIVSVPFSEKIQVDGMDYKLTASDLLNGSFTINSKTFSILPYSNAVADQTVVFSENLTNLKPQTDYYAWAFMFYAFQTSDAYPAIGEKISFTATGCLDTIIPISINGADTVCNGSATVLTASVNGIINPEYKWYSDSTSSAALLHTGNTYQTGVLNATTTYYVSVSGEGYCESEPSARKSIKVTVNPKANASAAVAISGIDTICSGSATVLTASVNGIINPEYKWYSDSTSSATLLYVGNTYQTGVLNATSTYYVSVSGEGYCESEPSTRKAIKVMVNPKADASAMITICCTNVICSGNTTGLTIVASGIVNPEYKWYSDSTSSATLLHIGNTYQTGVLNATTTYYVSVSGNGYCESDPSARKAVTVTVNPNADASTAVAISGADTICSGTATVLTANVNGIANAECRWYSDSTSSALLLHIGNVYQTGVLNATTTYYVSVSGEGYCESEPSARKAATVTVNSVPEVEIDPIVKACEGELTATLNYKISASQPNLTVLYNITFSGDALLAGFNNVKGTILTGNTISIILPTALSSGIYNATLTVSTMEGCTSLIDYPFYIQIIEKTQITKQPESVKLCNEDGFALSVVAKGQYLTYQWYQNGQAIQGATSPAYVIDMADSTVDYGTYYVVVSGLCGDDTSNTAEVSGNGLQILAKWTDVVFISNHENYFVSYQWYKNGKAIGLNSNYQSYLEEGGLDGTYYVVVTYADGTTEQSCQRTFAKLSASTKSVVVYPNPSAPYSEITINMVNYPLEEVENAKLEIINMLGQSIAEFRMTTTEQRIPFNAAVGIYTYRITTTKNEVIVGKIMVQY